MREKYSEHGEMKWEVGDVTDLKYPPGSFDLALDKAALDALISDKEGPWDYGEEVQGRLMRYVASTSRILKQGGLWIIISFEQPHFLRPKIACDDFEFSYKTVETNTLPVYAYILRKVN